MRETPEHSIIKVLAYFDLFNYPVTREEIQFFLDRAVTEDELSDALQLLVDIRCLYRLHDFYSLQNDPALAERRVKGNRHAQSLLITGYKISKFLYRFPYVRGIGISGSLSKNFAGEKADIDFFIITKANRLWVARTLMHLFKKLTYLAGRQHWFCMNYYIDEEALCIEEQNIFTATELITLLPVYGNGTMDKFFRSNNWAVAYFPNYINRRSDQQRATGNTVLKKAAEWLLNNRLGDALDNYLMNVTGRRWKKKEDEQRLNIRGIRMGLHVDKHFSKPNPLHFQQKVLERYHQKLKAVELMLQEQAV